MQNFAQFNFSIHFFMMVHPLTFIHFQDGNLRVSKNLDQKSLKFQISELAKSVSSQKPNRTHCALAESVLLSPFSVSADAGLSWRAYSQSFFEKNREKNVKS
jgi:hypothetical protein